MTVPADTDDVVAVVGMGVAVPGACGPGELWRTVNGGQDIFSEPGDRFELSRFWSQDRQEADRTYARRAGYLHDFRPHPALRDAEKDTGPGRDEAARWLRHTALQARSGVRVEPGYRCGAYVGAWPGGSQSLVESVLVETLARSAPDDEQAERVRAALLGHYRHALPLDRATGLDAVVRAAFAGLTERVTETFVVDTACASSLYAVDLGSKALLAGECEIAYCGGVNVVDPTMAVMFAKLSGLSPRGRVRAFTGASDGTLFSDGAGLVALKTLRRAREDGDTVLGLVLGFGGAADGRGKSISAPNPAGQRRAIVRARTVNSVTAEQVDWVLAHGTGTPAGDGVESQVLTELAPDSGQWCSSNKPVFGHTGWTAGVLSLMHALLALRHGWIPEHLGAQETEHGTDGARVRVPGTAVRFAPRQDGPRTVGVSAFGFGGTNAHLLVTDRLDGETPRSSPPDRPDSEEVALVAWSVHLPGDPPTTSVRDWLRGMAAPPEAGFPRPYPAPPPADIRMPRRTIPVIDPCQLMALQAAARFVTEHGEIWKDVRETTGVIAAHTGMPRGLVATTVRCYANDATWLLDRHRTDPAFSHVAQRLESLRQGYPATTEDSQAGVLPNVIASRIAARYDLHGPSMAVDAGRDGTLAALRVAHRYLRTGELDLALVVAVNGNGTTENAVLAGLGPAPLGEGAFLLAVTTNRTATERGLPVLARLSFRTAPHEQSPATEDRSYLAADHALALLRAVERRALPARLPAVHQETVLLAEPADKAHPGQGTDSVRYEETCPRQAKTQARPRKMDSGQGGENGAAERLTLRYRKKIVPRPRPGTRPGAAGVPIPSSLPRRGVVLLASPDAGATVHGDLRGSDSLVLDLPGNSDRPMSAAALESMLTAVDSATPHLTVVGDLSTLSVPRALALHDAVFLITQRLWSRWQPESSLAVVLAGAPADRVAHPAAALFDGFVKSLRWERPGTVAFTFTTDEPVTTGLLARVAEERSAHPLPPPVLFHLQGRRWTEALHPVPLMACGPPAGLPLHDGSVGLVTGGAGGIVQALFKALSEHARPTLWLLGRTPEEPLPPELEDIKDERLTDARASLIRRLRESLPDLAPKSLVKRADALLKQRELHLTLEALRARFGEGRVHYLACDMQDEDAVRKAVAQVLHAEGRVDFVVHAAGQVASTLLGKKRLEVFRAIRDTKVLGHLHLRSALGSNLPSLWCNIGSYSGSAGAPGDTDYASANAYLEAAAETATGSGEITVGFTMWRQTGMGSDALFQEHAASQAQFTPISTAEGTDQFLCELSAAARTGGASVYLGGTERERLRRHFPGLVHDGPPKRPASRLWPSWRSTAGNPRPRGEWVLPTAPDDQRHLYDHLVSGKPTIPATFLLDMAAQAAEALVPGTFTTGFREARFDAFVRPLNRSRPAPLRIRARVARGPSGDGHLTTVSVSLHSDTLGPDGRMRPAGLRHFATEVLLSRHPLPDPPPWHSPAAAAPLPAEDPYAAPEAAVSLRGPFRNLSHCTVDGDYAQGNWTPELAGNPGLRTMTIPALLMCAALRTSALRPAGAHEHPLFVPRSVSLVRLQTAGANDHDLLLCHGHELVVSVGRDGVHRAVTPTGRLLLELSGVDLVEMAT
ncbi:SDR family oxidoreductase [Streptomyces sp. b94]|uniref:SDR family oxidoreductase n=1 Tax=Streptomyces sp. b94 TaxID=1827634 RepID=UPI001B36420C|nr:SDR family oxidoreductase [Streptomyces sp. b94]MBQ1101155.1 SDR family oxidoreductase [Streptomyces sp. b94]